MTVTRLKTAPKLRVVTAHYHAGETNHCPGCGQSQWIVGRTTAECVFCCTALPLVDEHGRAVRIVTFGNGGGKIGRELLA